MIRVVLDTYVLVSALLFEGGRLAWIRQSWQSCRITPVLAEPTARELLRVLAYPKFQLKPAEIEQFLAELLPWSETWRQPLEPSQLRWRDRKDQVFLDLAISASVEVLVSGDADLLALQDQLMVPAILDAACFRVWLQQHPLA
jgi:putative PIN family toxin of toxin-antitoxin system